MYNQNRCMSYGSEMSYETDGTKFEYEKSTMINNGMPMNGNMIGTSCAMPGVVCPPIYECPVENQVHRTIMHEVPHICPVNTTVVNHHVYRHTFTPCYTMNECNTCENVYDPCSCKNF